MIEAILALVAGLLIGSFLNVCIYRMPRDLSVVRPRSFCPNCEKTIVWYDNIPLLSYGLLKGPSLAALKYCLLSALLVGMILADFEERILPDEFTLGGLLAGLALSWVVPVGDGPTQFLLAIA